MRVIAAILLSVTLAHGQTLSQTGATEIDAIFQSAIQQGTIPGVVAIVASKDQILYHNAFGLQNVANQTAMQKSSIFRIASMTKPVTSAAIMLLAERGKAGKITSKLLPTSRAQAGEPLANLFPELKATDLRALY